MSNKRKHIVTEKWNKQTSAMIDQYLLQVEQELSSHQEEQNVRDVLSDKHAREERLVKNESLCKGERGVLQGLVLAIEQLPGASSAGTLGTGVDAFEWASSQIQKHVEFDRMHRRTPFVVPKE